MFDLRTEYLARFGALPAVQTCAAHDGEFDPLELERLSGGATPAIYVTCVGGELAELDTGPTVARLRWAAFVVAYQPDGQRLGRRSGGDVAAALALRILAELDVGAFIAAREPATKVRCNNMFATRTALRGYSLWVVTWDQATNVPAEDLEVVLNDFRVLRTDLDLAPADEEIDASTEVEFVTLSDEDEEEEAP